MRRRRAADPVEVRYPLADRLSEKSLLAIARIVVAIERETCYNSRS